MNSLRIRRSGWFLLGLALAVGSGCQPPAAPSSGTAPASGSAQTPPRRATGASSAVETSAAAQPERETWEAHYLQDAKVGYAHTAYYRESEQGRPIVKIVTEGTLRLLRFGKSVEQHLREVSWESEDGAVLRFENSVTLGGTPQLTIGAIEGDRATLTLLTAGKSTTETIPWPRGAGGSSAPLESLRRQPPALGETRELRVFLPVFNRVAVVTLRAVRREPTALGRTERELIRVETTAVVEGNPPLESIAWCDDRGEVWKTTYPALRMTTLQTTEQAAQAPGDVRPPDLGASTFVRVDPPLAQGHTLRRVKYRVTLEGGDAAAAFPQRAAQLVRKLPDGAAEITVEAVRPDSPPASVVDPPPKDADRRSTNLVQSDDPTVVKLAAEGAGAEVDPWTTAVKLEAFVRRYLQSVTFSDAFASAADVARDRRGDCTEHAVLLCALLRARGIPARTAVGLVYVEPSAAFGFHMWTEGYFDDRWIALDATVGRGGTSAAYLKVNEASLDGVDPLTAILPVVQLLGRLRIEVLERS